MIDPQTANQLGRIITLKLQGYRIGDIAKKMSLPRRQVDFLLWKHCREKALSDVPLGRVRAVEERWSVLYDAASMGVRAVKETA